MADESFNQLRADVGLIDLIDCTPQENERFAETEKNGGELPENICRAAGSTNEKPSYYRCDPKTDPEKEQLYILMKLSKDLRFIKIIVGVSFAISIIVLVLGIVSS